MKNSMGWGEGREWFTELYVSRSTVETRETYDPLVFSKYKKRADGLSNEGPIYRPDYRESTPISSRPVKLDDTRESETDCLYYFSTG